MVTGVHGTNLSVCIAGLLTESAVENVMTLKPPLKLQVYSLSLYQNISASSVSYHSGFNSFVFRLSEGDGGHFFKM